MTSAILTETGLTVEALKHVKHGRLYLIPASAETSGHLTTSNAKFYVQQLRELLETAQRLADPVARPPLGS